MITIGFAFGMSDFFPPCDQTGAPAAGDQL